MTSGGSNFNHFVQVPNIKF